jgi:hypothetical protein
VAAAAAAGSKRRSSGPSHPGALWIEARYADGDDDGHSLLGNTSSGDLSSTGRGGSAGSVGSSGGGGGGAWLLVTVRCASLELAATCVSDLAVALRVSELEATADFPSEMAALRETLSQVRGRTSRIKGGAKGCCGKLQKKKLETKMPRYAQPLPFAQCRLAWRLFRQVAEYNRLRQRLAVDSADGANRVKALVVSTQSFARGAICFIHRAAPVR